MAGRAFPHGFGQEFLIYGVDAVAAVTTRARGGVFLSREQTDSVHMGRTFPTPPTAQIVAAPSLPTESLTTVSAYQPMVVQGHQNGNSAIMEFINKADREIDQMLNVHDVRTKFVEHFEHPLCDLRIYIGLLKAVVCVVIDDLVGRNSVVIATSNGVIRHVVGNVTEQDRHVVVAGQKARKRICVYLHTRHVIGEKIVNDLQDS